MRKENIKEQTKHWLFYAAVFFCFFALYAATAQRGVSWQDSGEFQYRILAGDYHWHSGIARAHPLYILMARGFTLLFPKAAYFYAVNLFSGTGLALALALLAYNVLQMTRSAWAAVTAVSVLGFAHMAWWMGTLAEVYTWSLAFLMAEILCLIRYSETRDARWLVALFGVNGAHFGIHNAALLGLPVYAFLLASEAWRRRGRRAALVGGCAAIWLLGGGMIAWQAACLLKETGHPLLVVKSVLFGDGYERHVLGTGGFAYKIWAVNMALAGLSLVNPAWLFAGRVLFLRAEEGQRELWSWLRVLTVLHGVFWVRYFVPDQATFVLPTLGLLAVWVGLGVGRSSFVGYCEWSKTQKRRVAVHVAMLAAGVACAVVAPRLACEIAQRSGWATARSRSLPFRDEATYWVLPWKQQETSAARFVEAVKKQLGPGDVLLADSTAAGPLLAAREAGLWANGWRLVTPWSGETDREVLDLVRDGARKVYVVSPVAGYAPRSLLEAGCLFEPQGVVYRAKTRDVH